MPSGETMTKVKENRKPTKAGNGNILKPIWEEKGLCSGNGLTPSIPTIILPCNPIALVEILNILMASKSVEIIGVRNVLVSICDELLRQKLIDKQ